MNSWFSFDCFFFSLLFSVVIANMDEMEVTDFQKSHTIILIVSMRSSRYWSIRATSDTFNILIYYIYVNKIVNNRHGRGMAHEHFVIVVCVSSLDICTAYALIDGVY